MVAAQQEGAEALETKDGATLMGTYFHYTCHHMAEQIDAHGGWLEPIEQVLFDDRPLVWMTDTLFATAEELGLTSETLTCDRMEACYEVITDDAMGWTAYKILNGLDQNLCNVLERGRRPLRWHVANVPVHGKRIK